MGELDSKQKEYLQKAEEADRRAEATTDVNARETWRQVAASWRRMAEDILKSIIGPR
jgi:hypothetical protein